MGSKPPSKMNELIPLINELQDLFLQAGLSSEFNLPCIAVIGSQSSGKSSVLEMIIGRDCLPRGTGMVTRRPLVLQCRYSATDDYATFLHKPGVKFINREDIVKEINQETERLLGKKQTVSAEPISMQLVSPDCVDLTLVDLPGMTRIAMDGQESNVPELIRKMTNEFVSNENCLILAVSAANTDLANSDALLLAQQVDPLGRRTIGVLTKLDLMDNGTNALNILMNKEKPLVNGWIGVVNRSQKDIQDRKSVARQLADEMAFFQQHQSYKTIANKCGIKYLRNVLRDKLKTHIRNSIPLLRMELTNQLQEIEETLKSKGMSATSKSAKSQLVSLLHSLITLIEDVMDGKNLDNNSQLMPPAKISIALKSLFTHKLLESFNENWLTDETIRVMIKNCHGFRSGVFIPDASFEALLRNQIGVLENDCLECCQTVKCELIEMVIGIATFKTCGHTRLLELLTGILSSFVDVIFSEAVGQVKQLVEVEKDCVDMKHPDLNIFGLLNDSIRDTQGFDKGNLIHEGFLVKVGGKVTSKKRRYFRVYENLITFHVDNLTVLEKGSFYTHALSVSEQKDKKGKSVIVLSNTDGSILFRNHKELVLYSDQEDEQDWLQAFQKSLKKTHSSDTLTTLLMTQADESDIFDVKVMRKIVTSYFSLIKKSIAVIVPKLIRHSFINRFRREFGKHLYDQILASEDSDMDSLMEISVEEQMLIDGMVNKKAAIIKALESVDKIK